ncbi:MAG: hypothetical protein KKB20_15670 [Proteobacteria bacterium]|nr:hypothetical protein [Pseudomonadota bacterium]
MTIELMIEAEASGAGRFEHRVLFEQSPDHYPEYGRLLRAELDRVGGDLLFRAPSGRVYRLGRPKTGPDGLEVVILGDDPDGPGLPGEAVDRDVWAFLEWLIGRVGGEWTSADLEKTGAIYRVPGAPVRA